MSKYHYSIALALGVALLSIVGCDGSSLASKSGWNADRSKAREEPVRKDHAEEQADLPAPLEDEEVDESAESTANTDVNSEAPFSVQEEYVNYLGNVFLTVQARADSVTLTDVQANRGNCDSPPTGKAAEAAKRAAEAISGKAYQGKFPKMLKFGERFVVISSLCSASQIVELKVDTTEGSWTWKRP